MLSSLPGRVLHPARMTTNNGKVISALGSSSGKATGIHVASNGRAIGNRVSSKPGAIGIHAASNTLATGVRCGGRSRAIDARVGRTHGVSVITDNTFRRANALDDQPTTTSKMERGRACHRSHSISHAGSTNDLTKHQVHAAQRRFTRACEVV